MISQGRAAVKSGPMPSSGQSSARRFYPTAGYRALKTDEVHIWCALLDRPRSEVQHLEMMLSVDERSRALRFRVPKDRDRFISARGLLRLMIGYYLGHDPVQLRFRYGRHGKPMVDGEFRTDSPRFNLSHSNGMGLYAFAHGREVGVDLEWLRPYPLDAQVAERYLSRREKECLGGLPRSELQRAQLRSWTRREAYVKARGEGLSFLPKLSHLAFVPGRPVRPLSSVEESRQRPRWFLMDLDVLPEYVAALVVEGSGCQIICRPWPQQRVS